MSKKSKGLSKKIKKMKVKQITKNKNRTFIVYIACFLLIVLSGVTFSCLSMSKYGIDAVKRSISEQRPIEVNDLKSSLNQYSGGNEISEILDKNKLDKNFVTSIQNDQANTDKVIKLSKNTLSLNQARILLATLEKMKIKSIASSAKEITQERVYIIVIVMLIVIFLCPIIFLYLTQRNMGEKNSTNFIGTTIKEMISFLTFSIGLYTVVNSLFSGENISTVDSLAQALTFLYAWLPVNIILLAGVAIFNIYATTNSEK